MRLLRRLVAAAIIVLLALHLLDHLYGRVLPPLIWLFALLVILSVATGSYRSKQR